ncbi:hypothetical protein KIW84_022396 [Lathyrus oleraceus]|uniref:Uncharacterized protein n=1 Tax=Pisum sativum TaxID=3888 RepID=A0A9D5B6L3_PEA|nr:hypothetical protein KIW84_022396 [Pisum sativum]
MKNRFRRNLIVGFNSEAGWIDKESEVSCFAKAYFESIFAEHVLRRLSIDGVHFKALSMKDMTYLDGPFEMEVKETIWSSARDKSPGLNDLNFNFFKACWNILKEDLAKFVRCIEDKGPESFPVTYRKEKFLMVAGFNVYWFLFDGGGKWFAKSSAIDKEALIADYGLWSDGNWEWTVGLVGDPLYKDEFTHYSCP